MTSRNWMKKRRFGIRGRLKKMMKCIFSGEQVRVDEMIDSSESLATRDYSASGYSSRTGEAEPKVDKSNIEEAESSLRESGYLNYEEARALLGRLEYQKGNIEGALHVFEGIDIAAVTPKMRVSISRRGDYNRRHSQSDAAPIMSMHAVTLLFEAIFLKAKSLEHLGRFDAAQSCKIILDTVESALPDGLPASFKTDFKIQEILNKVVELVPELLKLAGDFQEAILLYRRALLYHWNLEVETAAKIQKEFAIFLLYSGVEASPPNLRSQIDSSFGPRNNIEEAVLLLLILLRKCALGMIKWDSSIMDHLTFALSVSSGLKALAHQVEELIPGILERNERYCVLSLCYHGEGEDMVALNLLRNVFRNREHPDCILEMMLASKICGKNEVCIEEGIGYACKALRESHGRCSQKASISNCLLGTLLSAKSRLVSSDSERTLEQSKALSALEASERMMKERDPFVVHQLCLENAEQRKLDIALYYAKQLLKLEAGASVNGYILLARILSSQKRFVDAETVINAALDQTGKWDQGELLRTKAKLQVAQDQLNNAIETYSQLLAVLQVQTKSAGVGNKYSKDRGQRYKSLELDTWNDLANVYTSLSQWRDAEVCLSKSEAISPFSASRWHSTGLLYQAKGLHQDALKSFREALNVEPNHVPSLISTACILRQLGSGSLPVIRSLLTDALRLDRTNPSAWFNLGLVYKSDPGVSALEVAECFEAAALLEETTPVEPFR
ncbi:protein NPGR2 isoform X2 [Rhodamnia argentea]|uniref:Protein NPGR2 isoform X2 n=1 Tax=Rhodamnia argentea TaxID=178133 RepID=A0ABM3GXL1_9MYRT|nr:protein NPGR2 isoform X2 [Rhodamnia argentea]